MTVAFNARTEVSPLPPGDPGVAMTISRMRRLVDQGKSSSIVRAIALQILNQARVRAFDWPGQARAIYDWVLRNITFTPDPTGKEGLQTAEWTLTYRRGDCDDFTTLMCSLLETIGMRTRIVTVASDPRDPSQFSHVYPEVQVDGRWIPVDAARRHPQFGVAPSRYARKRAWDTSSEAWKDMQLGANASTVPWARRGAYRPNRTAVWQRGNPLLGRIPRRFMGRGRGNYRMLQLGDDGWDAGDISSVIQAGTTGAANIITAERAAPQNLFPTTGPNARTPYGYSTGYGYGSAYPQQSIFGSISPTTMLLGLGLLGFAVAARR